MTAPVGEAVDELIAKLEAAPEGSRELDADIHCAITGRVTHRCLTVGFTMVGTGDTVKDFHLASSNYITSKRGPAPNYTTSLDAAMTLAPKGWRFQMFQDREGRWISRIIRNKDSFGVYPFESNSGRERPGTTAPLALCIAALKSRKATT